MINRNKKVFVSCGEMSGDLHLSYIIDEIRLKSNDIEFHGIVGDKSIAAGAIKVQHIKDNDIMGFYEVVKKIKYFKDKINQYIDYIVANDIKTVIFVDYGGFNLKFFEILKKKVPDIYTIYYIPPKVWAWGKKRIEKLKKFDEVITIFPFEKEYFDKENMDVKYFGNPFVDKYTFSNQLGDSILLLPGSRKQEIKSAVPIFLELVKNRPNEKFILKLATVEHNQYLSEEWLKLDNLIISLDSFDKIRDRLKYGISTSGTVTFELALMGLPQIVVYKTSKINAFIARKIVKITHISLTNLCANKIIFPELLQEDFTAENIQIQMAEVDINKETIVSLLNEEREKLGTNGVIEKIAIYLLERIQ